MRKLSLADVEDLVTGTTILGVGGGGNPEQGRNSLKEQLDAGKSLILVSLDELQPDDLLVSPYFVGSVAQPNNVISKPVIEDAMATALHLLEGKLGKRVAGTIPAELGGANTAASLAIAAKLGIPTVDGDLIGRAAPELHQSTVHIFGLPMIPSAIVSDSGNEIIIEKYASIDDYEAIARYASVVSGGHVAVVDTPLSVSQAKRCVVRGTISKSMEIGKARREAVEEKDFDVVDAISRRLPNCRRIFEGTVSDYAWKNEKGFLVGDARVRGAGKWEGMELKSWIMNEHIMCWKDGKPIVMPPDLIMFLEPGTGLGITNDKLAKDANVVVLGASVDKIWRSPEGLKLFGPRHFGFDLDYVPFEELSGS
ncbi:MAG: DUF917 domain-containing protein [Thaumarchaeota archaeon]|nr:DUF917 domain-containing protein [Nitrososphaerota archaeon]